MFSTRDHNPRYNQSFILKTNIKFYPSRKRVNSRKKPTNAFALNLLALLLYIRVTRVPSSIGSNSKSTRGVQAKYTDGRKKLRGSPCMVNTVPPRAPLAFENRRARLERVVKSPPLLLRRVWKARAQPPPNHADPFPPPTKNLLRAALLRNPATFQPVQPGYWIPIRSSSIYLWNRGPILWERNVSLSF